MKELGYFLFYCHLLLSATALKAQDKEMFIKQIAGKIITRESFKSNGKLLGRQEFVAEKFHH